MCMEAFAALDHCVTLAHSSFARLAKSAQSSITETGANNLLVDDFTVDSDLDEVPDPLKSKCWYSWAFFFLYLSEKINS